MATTYKTFTRSLVYPQSFSAARKTTRNTGLTYEQAYEECERYNAKLTAAQIRKGTKCEFIRE